MAETSVDTQTPAVVESTTLTDEAAISAVCKTEQKFTVKQEEGQVALLISKRLRALKKKVNRISQIEESIAKGKAINKEQDDVLKSKASVLSLVEELEKLKAPLLSAVQEEVQEEKKKFVLSDETSAKVSAEPKQQDGIREEDLKGLVELLYFGSLFDNTDVTSSESVLRWSKEQERNSCLSYDVVSDEDSIAPLTEEDLDMIAALSRKITVRNLAAGNHLEAVGISVVHVRKWIDGSNEPVDDSLPVTYSHVKSRLQRIVSSEYFTQRRMTVNPEAAAAAAASGSLMTKEAALEPVVVVANEKEAVSIMEQLQEPLTPTSMPAQPAVVVQPIAAFVPQGGFTVIDPIQQASDPPPQPPPVYLPNGIQFGDLQQPPLPPPQPSDPPIQPPAVVQPQQLPHQNPGVAYSGPPRGRGSFQSRGRGGGYGMGGRRGRGGAGGGGGAVRGGSGARGGSTRGGAQRGGGAAGGGAGAPPAGGAGGGQ